VFGGAILALAEEAPAGPSILTSADVVPGVAQGARVGRSPGGGITEIDFVHGAEVLLTLGSECWPAHGARFPSGGTEREAVTPAVLPAIEAA
jgi:hypothetical protein